MILDGIATFLEGLDVYCTTVVPSVMCVGFTYTRNSTLTLEQLSQ